MANVFIRAAFRPGQEFIHRAARALVCCHFTLRPFTTWNPGIQRRVHLAIPE